MTAYDTDNIFAKILRGEMPAHKVYEDDDVFAFMDIMPRADGHTLVIPKTPARNMTDIAPDALARLIQGVQHVAQGVVKAMDAEGFIIQQFNESAGGQIVFHIHFHIVPRWDGVKLRPPAAEMADGDVLQQGNPPDTGYVKFVKIKSEAVSEFWGHPMYIGANVLLPEGYDPEGSILYPVLYMQGHFVSEILARGAVCAGGEEVLDLAQ